MDSDDADKKEKDDIEHNGHINYAAHIEDEPPPVQYQKTSSLPEIHTTDIYTTEL